MLRLIVTSRVYQHSIQTDKWNEDDNINFSHAIARRLPAETLYDALHQATGTPTHIPGVRLGTRAAELPDPSVGSGTPFPAVGQDIPYSGRPRMIRSGSPPQYR